MTRKEIDTEAEDRQIGNLLRAVGRRKQLPPYLADRWEQKFRQELQSARRERWRGQWPGLALAMAVVFAVAGLWLFQSSAPATAIFAEITRVIGDHVEVEDGSGQLLNPTAGTRLKLPFRVHTGASSYLALKFQQRDLRLNTATKITVDSQQVDLHAGEIYISSQASHNDGISVVTEIGRIRDIGTQFTVRLDSGQLITRVRRGAVELQSAEQRITATASGGNAQQIRVDGSREISVSEVSAADEHWQWIHKPAPGFQLEGSSAHDFLNWVSSETGLDVEYLSENVEIHARTTILHGDIDKMMPLDALPLVLASTELVIAEHTKEELRVTRVRMTE